MPDAHQVFINYHNVGIIPVLYQIDEELLKTRFIGKTWFLHHQSGTLRTPPSDLLLLPSEQSQDPFEDLTNKEEQDSSNQTNAPLL